MSIKKENRINLLTALLDAIAEGESGIAKKISKEHNISKVSVYKYLSSLEKEKIISRTGRGKYELLNSNHLRIFRENMIYDDKPVFTLIAGVNGCGKSSFSGVMQESDKYLKNIVDVDKITWQIFQEKVAKILPTKDEEYRGAKKAIGVIREYLKNEETFAEETTLAGRSLLNTIRTAKEKGYRIRMFYIGIDSAAECKRRIKNRVKRGGHNIPDSDVEHRFATRRNALWRVLPLCDEAEFYDNNNGFRKVAIFHSGKIISTSESNISSNNNEACMDTCNMPHWLKEII